MNKLFVSYAYNKGTDQSASMISITKVSCLKACNFISLISMWKRKTGVSLCLFVGNPEGRFSLRSIFQIVILTVLIPAGP